MTGSPQTKEALGQGQVTPAPDAHLLQPLLEHARQTPDKPLFSRRVGGRFEPLTASDIARTVRRPARGLMALGIEPGQRVALMSKTRVDEARLDERLSRLRTSDLATLIYTSGTTGRPRCGPSTPARPHGLARWASRCPAPPCASRRMGKSS